ncbi:MAG: hypothetical protein QXJ68_03630 [Methanocellales archaeon]
MEGEVERRFITLLKERTSGKIAEAKEGPKIDIPNLEIDKKLLRIKKLESEHQSNIEQYLKRIQELGEKREKLKKAIEILLELKLNSPEEYTKQIDSYSSEIEKLGVEIERERMYLNYLQQRILPLISI